MASPHNPKVIPRARNLKVLEEIGIMVMHLHNGQQAIDKGRNTFPADKSFIAALDVLQDEMDAKVDILSSALTALKGI